MEEHTRMVKAFSMKKQGSRCAGKARKKTWKTKEGLKFVNFEKAGEHSREGVERGGLETHVLHISESLFEGLCREVGTSEQVNMRRGVVDIKGTMTNCIRRRNENRMMCSGSRREGFRLKGSDLDGMYWLPDEKVIWDLFQFYSLSKYSEVFVSDSSDSPPGYTLLWLLTPMADTDVIGSLFTMNDRFYISSYLYRKLKCSAIMPNSIVHGPCGSGNVSGVMEYDTAACFACDFWPPSASSWIDRCHSWPSLHIVHDAVKNGCHLVPLRHKLGKHENDEWRISFSSAEQKLVYAMNHYQFLVYGLLKLFLKEVINREQDDDSKLLCSYHMKTAIFWVLQQGIVPYWNPQNLLECFWVSFKLILKWVYEGVCPNFFIPQNNMFLANIHGASQRKLFLQLYTLYKKGFSCLLHSHSIRPYIENVLYNPMLSICTDDNGLMSEANFDVTLFHEMYQYKTPGTPDFYRCMKALYVIEHLVNLPLTKYQVPMLQNFTASILKDTAFILHNMYSTYIYSLNTVRRMKVNKVMYLGDKMSRHMLNLAIKFGWISDMLYIAVYYYKTLRYKEALTIIEMAKIKLAQPHLLYKAHVNTEKYIEAVGGKSFSSKMRKAVVWDILFDNRIHYIDELQIEQESCSENKVIHALRIPPYVVLHMLEFFCCIHVNHESMERTQEAVDNLEVLLHNDLDAYVPEIHRDISWQILGICQQIAGNRQAALFSFQQSLRQFPLHQIQTAAMARIQNLC
ncbi:uncharacterized protein LOC134255942 [Saccostrea cucullata]|uniref:uncharacterized protein LOC134255942 n=1 Tax=Saccostrea cuccullata TaxID=36930 RepID=UPI002ED58D78